MELNKEKNKTTISVNLKRWQGTDNNRETALYLQVIYRRKVRQISLPYKTAWRWMGWKQTTGNSPPRMPSWAVSLSDGDKPKNQRRKTAYANSYYIESYKALLRGNTFIAYIEQIIKQFAAEDRNASVRHYRSLHNSFLKYLPTENILLNDIDEELIKKYESWLIERKLHPNTVSFYMRNLKALWNRAVNDGIIEARPHHSGILIPV